MPRRTERLLIAFAAIALLAQAVLFLDTFEDSFITYRYARNFAAGNGLVYNVGERVDGFTSFGWTVLLGVLAKLGLEPPSVAPALSLACGALFVVLVARRSPYIAFLAAASPSLAYHASTGMETTAFLCLFLGGVLLGLSSSKPRQLGGGALLAIAALFRPEGLGYAIAVIAALASFDRRRALAVAGVFVAVFAPWFLWRASYYGHPFPNPYYAKASPSFDRFRVGFVYLECFLTLHGWWLLVPAIVLVAKRKGLDPWSRVGVAVIAATAANVVLVGGDIFVFWRFLLPALPFAIGFAVDAVTLVARKRRVAWGALAVVGIVPIVVAFLPQFTLLRRSPRSAWLRQREEAALTADRRAVGRFLAETFPPTTSMAVNAAGIVPYESSFTTIDMLGINDARIGHREMPKWEGALGHQKHDAEYVLSRAPDLVLPGSPVVVKRAPRPDEVASLLAREFAALPGDKELLENPEFQRQYSLAVAQVDDGRFLIFFRRRDASLALETH